METVQVKKIVAVCFLEAVKMSLDDLGSYRMLLANEGSTVTGELPRIYGEVRRLRDYLQRCVSAYRDIAELELTKEDQGLLVASCRRYVDWIDTRLAGPEVTDSKERQFVVKKQQVIADWTVELAAKPFVEFPLPRLNPVLGDGGRALKTRVEQKLFSLSEQSIIVSGVMKPLRDGLGVSDAEDSRDGGGGGDGWGGLAETGIEADGDPLYGAPSGLREQARPPLLDPAALQDPRLRALVAMDLRSLELVECGSDQRLTTILMATILESAVLDHAIPRRAELGLTGGPDTWHPQEILFRVLGDQASPSDRSQAYSLFYSRRLLSPAQQMVTPMVATRASVKGLREFVGKMLHQLGYATAASKQAVRSRI